MKTTTKSKPAKFVHISISNDESSHQIGITSDGTAYTWGKSNGLGQLGRKNGKSQIPQPAEFTNLLSQSSQSQPHSSGGTVNSIGRNSDFSSVKNATSQIKASKAFVGGTKDAGHSAILDADGKYLWFAGCDRWQQLGLGSSSGGAAGYTWKNGALWQETFQRNDYLRQLMDDHNGTYKGSSTAGAGKRIGGVNVKNNGHYHDNDRGGRIRDVALGGDHTVVLSENKRDVYTFGKGREGQLGLGAEKPFVSCPVHAKALSSRGGVNANKKNGSADTDADNNIAAVCAIRYCSFTLDSQGNVLKSAGKCRQWTSDFMAKAVQTCRTRASKDGLIDSTDS